MRIGTLAFRLMLCVGWAVLLFVSIHAVKAMGMGAAGAVFIGDFAHPWRAQFNTDLSLYLLLTAAWMVYRSRNWAIGLVWALLAVNLGSLVTLAYLLVASIHARGDMRVVLLGHRANISAATQPPPLPKNR